MRIINEITTEIVKNSEDGESIHSLAAKTGFAYSAVYKWKDKKDVMDGVCGALEITEEEYKILWNEAARINRERAHRELF